MNVTPKMPGRGRAIRWLAAAGGALAACGLLAAGAGPAAAAPRASTAHVTSTGLRPACPVASAGHMRCFVLYQPLRGVNRASAAGPSARSTHPVGWGATTLEHAYGLPVSRQSHETVAVSIAFRTPNLGLYLRTYRAHYGLPACGQPSGCLRIVNQQGKANPLPQSGLGSGWDLEATLDVSMISAACPHCKILVVEASDTTDVDLAKTDDTAARLGATVISNSYGQRENGLAMVFRGDYHHPGHTVVASSGDFGYDAANFPANLSSVTAVGGTTLARAHTRRGFTERVWNDPNIFGASSSGCSAYVAKPSWQHDAHCPGRTVADISAVAANVPIYNKAWGGWITVAGTSVAAPFVSGIYGLAGNAASLTPRHLYEHENNFFDVTLGNNSLVSGSAKSACGADYLCQARKGYDAPTGLGTPDGIGGF
jgi:Subtilase family